MRALVDGLAVDDHAASVAVLARLAERLEQALADPLAGHLHEPERRHLGDLVLGPVAAEAFATWRTAIDEARAVAANTDLDAVFEHPVNGPTSLRWVLIHLIEEYARHNGHADLLREAIDGATGE